MSGGADRRRTLGWSHLVPTIGAGDGFERMLLAPLSVAPNDDGFAPRIGAAEPHRSISFRVPQLVNRARPEAAA